MLAILISIFVLSAFDLVGIKNIKIYFIITSTQALRTLTQIVHASQDFSNDGKSWARRGEKTLFAQIHIYKSAMVYMFFYYMISAVLHVLSIGENMLTIWGAKAEAYLAVNHHGNVYTTVSNVLWNDVFS